jgi:alanine racemase
MPVSTWVEVDLDRFTANLRAIRELGGPGRDVLLVVKADAYGHGAIEISEAAVAEGVAVLGVATLHEGIQLRRSGCPLPILVLSPLLPGEVNEAVAHELEPTVCEVEFAHAFSRAATAAGRPLRVHVEVDTGMGRTGVRVEDAEHFLVDLLALPGLRLASLYTHSRTGRRGSDVFRHTTRSVDSAAFGRATGGTRQSIRLACTPRTAPAS